MGRHLGIDFRPILVNFGMQVTGVGNRAKIDPKGHRKSDEKKKVTKMAKKSLQDAAEPRRPPRPEPQEGSPPVG